jgi:hypothetical protein
MKHPFLVEQVWNIANTKISICSIRRRTFTTSPSALTSSSRWIWTLPRPPARSLRLPDVKLADAAVGFQQACI